jgi:hypothetical protein
MYVAPDLIEKLVDGMRLAGLPERALAASSGVGFQLNELTAQKDV